MLKYQLIAVTTTYTQLLLVAEMVVKETTIILAHPHNKNKYVRHHFSGSESRNMSKFNVH